MSLGQPNKKQSVLLILFVLIIAFINNTKLHAEWKVLFCVLGFLEMFAFAVIFDSLDEQIGKLELGKGSK